MVGTLTGVYILRKHFTIATPRTVFSVMILGQVSYTDCVAFLIFLVPQLLLNINVSELIVCGLKTLPFLCKTCFYSTIAILIRRLSLIHVSSCTTPMYLFHGEISYQETTANTICTAGISVPGFCHPMCTVRFCEYSRSHWAYFFLERGFSALSKIPYAAPWVSQKPCEVARN